MSTATQAPTTASGIWLVAEREIDSKIRSKAFVFSTIFMMALMVGLVVWIAFTAQGPSTTPVAVTSDAQEYVDGRPGLEVTSVADRAGAEALVDAGDVDAAVVTDSTSPTGYALIGKTNIGTTLMLTFATLPNIELLDGEGDGGFLRYLVAIGFGAIFLIAAQTFGMTIAQSAVEEKQTRVVEILLSTISTKALLAGKVIGNTILAMGQILLFAAVAVIGLTITDQGALLQGIGAPIVWFAIFFLFGFVLLASMFAAAGALVSRVEDIGTTTTPLIFLVMAPYFLVIFFNDNPLVLTIMSYVPFSAPVGMPLRLFAGEAMWWEPLLSLAILAVSCIAAIWLAGKIYENAILKMGARVKISEALSSKS